MKINLAINSQEDLDYIEISIASNSETYLSLSKELKSLDSDKLFELEKRESKSYKNQVERLICKLKDNTNQLFDLTLERNCLIFSGDRLAFSNLSETLLNLSESEKSDSPINCHFHIDYYEGNGILNETNISLVLELVENF